jgi:hypothetical protein
MSEFLTALSQLSWPGAFALAAIVIGLAWVIVGTFK